MALLLREAIGERLRRVRTAQRRTLRDVSRDAKVSLGYLSEVARGRKEASSELLAAICAALALPLADLLREVAFDLGNGTDTEFGREFERNLDRELDRVIEGGRLAPATVGDAKAELRIAPALTHRLSQPISGSPTAGSPVSALASAGLPPVPAVVVAA